MTDIIKEIKTWLLWFKETGTWLPIAIIIFLTIIMSILFIISKNMGVI